MSVPTTRRHMAKMRKLFEIDETRLPKKGMLPKKIVNQYFQVDQKIKDKQIDETLTS